MIYAITGEDRAGVGKLTDSIVAILQKKRPDAALFRISGDEWSRDIFDSVASGQGLFEHKYIVVLDSIFQNEEAAEYVESRMAEFKKSEHAFIFVEISPKAPIKKLLEKHAEKTWSPAEVKGSPAPQKFNIFSLTDALGERDRAKLWVLYQKALASGSEPEEIHGILFWQIKALVGAASSKSAVEAGLKPFVWGKAQSFLKNYSLPELKKISGDMVSLYHNARLESLELRDSLEVFLLSNTKPHTRKI
jgi:hypothetical protein